MQIKQVKKHWYQVTKRGAAIDASSFDKSILFKYTIEIETTQYAAMTYATYILSLIAISPTSCPKFEKKRFTKKPKKHKSWCRVL